MILLLPFPIFFICIFATRFYMIWQAKTLDGKISFLTILISCLKFWDSGLLIQAYFGFPSKEAYQKLIEEKRKTVQLSVSEQRRMMSDS